MPIRLDLKQWLIGTHHGVSPEQLQVYLDEFVFRHNRRQTPMAAFQTLLGLGAGREPTDYERIRGAADLSRANPSPLGSAETPDKHEMATPPMHLQPSPVTHSVRRAGG